MLKDLNLEKYKGKILQGVVSSAGKMSKTIIVKIERRIKHPVYKKIVTRYTKLHVHDEVDECSVGDVVKIKEYKKMSKTKSWVLLSIIEKKANL